MLRKLPPLKHRFLIVEGNIGAGKTTFSEKLAHDYDTRLILEEFADNPFLPFFYENPERYAFPVELFFMTERHKQLQEKLSQQSLFQNAVVADYFFTKTLLFAKNNLGTEEYRLFQRLFGVLDANFPKPDLLVYLYRSVDDLLTNIRNRGRAYEQNITKDYLEKIQTGYFDYFKTITDTPILILDITGVSFWKDEAAYRAMVEATNQNYPVGLNRLTLETF